MQHQKRLDEIKNMPINLKSKFSNVSYQAGVPLDITDKILFYKSRNTEFKKSLKQS
jgi:hypothetical protein